MNPADDSSANGLWRQAAEINRRIDKAVETFERQLRGGDQPATKLPTEPVASDAPREPMPAPPRPPAAPLGFSLDSIGAPLPTRSVMIPAAPTPPVHVDLRAVDTQLAGELDALRASRTEPEALTFPVPWSGAPRPLFVATPDMGLLPNPVSDDEIRDVVQPHWRAVHEQAAAADSALLRSREAFDKAGPFRRFGSARKALAAAQSDWDEAVMSKDALDLLWQGDAMRRQFERFREAADTAFGAAMANANRQNALEAQIAEVERQRGMIAALLDNRVTALRPAPGQTRGQTLEAALARLARPVQPIDRTSDHASWNETGSGADDSDKTAADADTAKIPSPATG